MSIRVCATGDSMLLHLFPAGYDWESVARAIGACDVRVTNLEAVLSNWDCCASTYCGGQWINAEPDRLPELLRYGFNLVSCANNHSMDYSYDGLASTMRTLRRAGVSFAGVGESLEAAQAPARIVAGEPGRRVAMLSATSTFIDAARAGSSRGSIPARPGVNPLRVKTSYRVSPAHLEQLREIARATYINGERDNARRIGSLPPEAPGSFNFGGHFFLESRDGTEGKEAACDRRDLDRILAGVRAARADADLVLVSIHSHQIARDSYREPDRFLVEFAHACIDAGADAVIGGGTHQLKPVEVYRGKPVFYSLGNFIFQSGMVAQLPADYWDKYQFPVGLSVAQAQARKTKGGTIGLETDEDNYLSVLPRIDFDDAGNMTALEFVPIELGFGLPRAFKGLPRIAADADARRIRDRLAELSAPYGMSFALDGGVISADWEGRA